MLLLWREKTAQLLSEQFSYFNADVLTHVFIKQCVQIYTIPDRIVSQQSQAHMHRRRYPLTMYLLKEKHVSYSNSSLLASKPSGDEKMQTAHVWKCRGWFCQHSAI